MHMAQEKQNANPTVYSTHDDECDTNVQDESLYSSLFDSNSNEDADDEADPFDAREVFQMIRHLNDPEHPLTLEQLNVVSVCLLL